MLAPHACPLTDLTMTPFSQQPPANQSLNHPRSQVPYAMAQDDEINLIELVDKFVTQWRWWVSSAVAGGLLALGIAVITPAKYEARGVVKVAQVPKQTGSGDTSAMFTPSPVESASESIIRMQSLAFRQEVASRLLSQGSITREQKNAWTEALSDKSAFKGIKDASNYVEINVTASSPKLGHAAVEIIVQVLKERQQSMVEERLQQLERDISLAKANLSDVENSYTKAQESLQRTAPSRESYLELARLSEAGTLATQRQKVLDLESAKLPPITKATELVEPIGVTDNPVSPKKPLLIAAGIVLGGALGTLMGFSIPAWRSYRARRDAESLKTPS